MMKNPLRALWARFLSPFLIFGGIFVWAVPPWKDAGGWVKWGQMVLTFWVPYSTAQFFFYSRYGRPFIFTPWRWIDDEPQKYGRDLLWQFLWASVAAGLLF